MLLTTIIPKFNFNDKMTMRNEELQLISKALQSKEPERSVTEACRRILLIRIEQAKVNDRDIRTHLNHIVNAIDFPLTYTPIENKPTIKRTIKWKSAVCGVVCGIGGVLISTLIKSPNSLDAPYWVAPLCGGIISLCGGYALGESLTSKIQVEYGKDKSLRITTTAEHLIKKIDEICTAFQPLFSMNQLNGRYKEVLRWFQTTYSMNGNRMEYRQSVANFLKSLGYEFVEYDSQYSQYFEASEANVSQPTTSLYAIKSIADGEFIINGKVIFPLISK